MAEAGQIGAVALGLDLLLELVRWIRGRKKRKYRAVRKAVREAALNQKEVVDDEA